jgi:hypothetical protein
MKANHLLSTVLQAELCFKGAKAHAIYRTEWIAVTVKAFTFLEMNTLFNQGIDLGNFAAI